MVEQLTCNQWVGGSIPFAGSSGRKEAQTLANGGMNYREASPSKFKGFHSGEVPERSKGADCKSAGSAFGGSNPPLSTITAFFEGCG
jgi:hypothetical protein